MKPKLLLRTASIIMLLHDAGHTFGHLSWKQTTDPAKQEVINQMSDKKFPFMGAERSMGEYYEGYGWAAALALLLIAAILWITAGHVTQNTIFAKKILVVISIILLAWGIDELLFFFPFAAAFSLLAALLTAIAIFQLRTEQK